MKKTLKLGLLSALLVAAFSAMAADPVANSGFAGRVDAHVSTSAAVSGTGSSTSFGQATAKSTADGWATISDVAGGKAISIGGSTVTEGFGMAYNVSTGGGTGAASAAGWSDAGSAAGGAYVPTFGALVIGAASHDCMVNQVKSGIDFSVVAGLSQDG